MSCLIVDTARELGCDDEDFYTPGYIKEKVRDKYGQHVFIGQKNGRMDIICFVNMASYIVNDQWCSDRRSSADDDSERIIVAAAELLRSEIRKHEINCTETYPTPSDISDAKCGFSWLPPLLQAFMKVLMTNELKHASLGQCLVQAVRPKSVIPPIP